MRLKCMQRVRTLMKILVPEWLQPVKTSARAPKVQRVVSVWIYEWCLDMAMRWSSC